MSNQMAQLQEATIKAQCKTLPMPMIASQFGTLDSVWPRVGRNGGSGSQPCRARQ